MSSSPPSVVSRSDAGVDNPVELAARLADELAQSWRAGERLPAEEFLGRHPSLADHPEGVLELIAEELYQRQQSGEPVDDRQLEDRFPRWRQQVRALAECHRVLSLRLAPPRFPATGEELGEFRLLAELGRGTHGRVFLAAQPALSDRPVVLKLGPGIGEEHLSLARLQHTHIVPLYSVHDFPERGLRALCLPYFGGATLAELLQFLRDKPPGRRAGCDLVAALREGRAALAAGAPTRGPACEYLARESYVRAICWIGVCLADALAYAADRGVLHLDLKPSNVLLADDGQPMLLDFHLSRACVPAGSPAPAWLGGTPAYMAPEQRSALAAVREGGDIVTAVDDRADVYGLGLLLYESLGGPVPPPAPAAATLRRRNPRVSAGLAALLAKCLAPDPERRYAGAAAVAADLRRHLGDLPLRGVADRSVGERWRKWRRRRPIMLPLFVLLAAGVAGGVLFAEKAGKQVERARLALAAGEEHFRQRQYGEAVEAFRHGVDLAEDVPFCGELTGQLRERLHLADRRQAASELHQLCEHLRPLYGAEPLQTERARAVLAHCRTFWDRRRLITERLAVRSDPGLEQQVRADLLDLAILWADLRVRLATSGELALAREEALARLEEAESLFGPSRVLAEEQQCHARALGRQPAARAGPAPRNAWEHLALGRTYFRAGDVDAAEREIDRALALEPGTLWPNYFKGSCAYRAKHFDDAVAAFSACVALAPQSAWCFANRGLAYSELGRADRAADDFEQALRLDPTHAAAVRGRGMLRYRTRRYAEALADLRRTLDLGVEPAAAYADLALVHCAAGNREEALVCARRALGHDPTQPLVRELLDRIGRER